MAILHNGRRITSLRVSKDETSEGTGGSGGTPTLQGKTVTPSRESQVVRSDDGYDGLSYVLVEAIPATEQAEPSITVDQNGLITASVDQDEGYVTEGIKSTTHQLPTQGAKVITPGKTVQTAVEGGVFTTGPITVAAVEEVKTAERGVPSISVDAAGLVSSSVTQEEGYVTAGTERATKQLTTQAAKTVTPSTSKQTAVEAGVFTTGAVTVDAIPSSYVVPSGTRSITANGEFDVASYQKVNVNVAAAEPVLGSVSTPGDGTATIRFSGLPGEPSWFTATMSSVHTAGYYIYVPVTIIYHNGTLISLEESDGRLLPAVNAANWYSWSYSGSTLTISAVDSYFITGMTYTLYYGI